MRFKPQIKPKRCNYEKHIKPFPNLKDKVHAVFTGYSIEVVDTIAIIELYENGFYGKGSHSRSAPNVVRARRTSDSSEENNAKTQETLVLGLEEAFFLNHILGIIEISDLSERMLDTEELFGSLVQIKENFPSTYAAYLYLKSKNWVVKAGTKFGGDFLLYKNGPRFYHASFVVYVTDGQNKSQKDLKGIQRVAETSDKDVLFLEVCPPKDIPVESKILLNYYDKFTISEYIAKRLDFKQYVQIT